MANVYMTPVIFPNNEYPGTIGTAWEYSDTLSSPGNGDSVLIPSNIRKITASLIISTGAAKIQTTTSPISAVLANTANWIDWDSGEIATDTRDSSEPVTAIRQVNVSGSSIMELRTQ